MNDREQALREVRDGINAINDRIERGFQIRPRVIGDDEKRVVALDLAVNLSKSIDTEQSADEVRDTAQVFYDFLAGEDR